MNKLQRKTIRFKFTTPDVQVRTTYAVHNIRIVVPEIPKGDLTFPERIRHPWGLPIVVFALIVGLGGGSYVTWMTKFGKADSEQNQVGLNQTASTNSISKPWVKPLEFSSKDLNIVADMLPVLIEESRHIPTAQELANQNRTKKLKQYFQKRNSPFVDDKTVEAFLNAKNMKLMIAISFVESTMGQKCYFHNCSGIGGTPPNLRKYESYADWVKDFDALLENRYKGLPIEDFIGLYVQPGSPNWINGVKQILTELKEQGIE